MEGDLGCRSAQALSLAMLAQHLPTTYDSHPTGVFNQTAVKFEQFLGVKIGGKKGGNVKKRRQKNSVKC